MERPELFRLLTDILKPEQVPLAAGAAWPPEVWAGLFRLAATQAVSPLLYERIRARGLAESVPVEILSGLKAEFRKNSLRNLAFQQELNRIAEAFEADGIPLIILKGGFLVRAVYAAAGLRVLGDLDFLVRVDDLARAAGLIETLGYESEVPMTAEWAKVSKHLPVYSRKGGTEKVEIHWSIVRPGRVERFDVGEFWGRAIPAGLNDTALLALSPEDLLLHLCYHNAISHNLGFALRPYCDLQAVIEKFRLELDWDQVVERALRWQWGRGVYMSLRLARDLVGARVPTHVLDRLVSNGETESVYALVLEQLEEDLPFDVAVAVEVAKMSSQSLPVRLRLMRKRLFPSRLELALHYGIRPDSPGILLRYPRRWLRLLRRAFDGVLRVMPANGGADTPTMRKAKVIEWLQE